MRQKNMKLDLNSFGKKLKLSKRVKKVKVLTEKEMFVDLLSRIEECGTRSNSLYYLAQRDWKEYEEDFFLIIEDLLLLKFGEWKTELMLWYIYGRLNDKGVVQPLILRHKSKPNEKVYLKNIAELWEFFNQLEEQKRKDEEK